MTSEAVKWPNKGSKAVSGVSCLKLPRNVLTRPPIGENPYYGGEADGTKKSHDNLRQTAIYDMVRQLAASCDNFRLFVPLT